MGFRLEAGIDVMILEVGKVEGGAEVVKGEDKEEGESALGDDAEEVLSKSR